MQIPVKPKSKQVPLVGWLAGFAKSLLRFFGGVGFDFYFSIKLNYLRRYIYYYREYCFMPGFDSSLIDNFIILSIKSDVFSKFTEVIFEGIDKYKDAVFGGVLGFLGCGLYHRYVGMRSLINAKNEIVSSKNETINALKQLVYERLETVDPPKQHSGLFNRLKTFFRT